MANFCHHCARPVTPDMNACPHCGTHLYGRPTAVAAASAPSLARGAVPPAFPAAYAGGVVAGAGWEVASYPKASFGARVIATFVDTLVQGAALIPGALLLAIGAGGRFGAALLAVLALVGGIAWAFYYGFTKDGRPGGASIGKQQVGLMVVHLPTNTPCTVGQSAVRAAVMLGLQVVPLVGWLIEPAVALTADDGRRLGDRVADTQVIAARDYRP